MDNFEDINVWKISRPILYRYYPVCIFFCLLSALLYHTRGGEGSALMIIFVPSLVIIPLMYLFAVIPVIIFKPEKLFTRQLVMIIFSLFFIMLLTALNLSQSPDASLNPIRFSKDVIFTGQGLLILAFIICRSVYNEEKQYITKKRIIAEQEKRINNEKMVTETYLKLLQAQIEPHFLFNTLTSIFRLSDKNPQKAKIMLNNFMQYLETTLIKTRASVTTIGQEIDLIKAYLDIFKVRMGKRLQYSVNADKDLLDHPFPSMLIQPIVENAIKHGLETKIGGGEINIQVKKIDGDKIRWIIEDTGLGMSDKSHLGTGLSNIMERLEALYDDEGDLSLEDNTPSGVKVTLEVPHV